MKMYGLKHLQKNPLSIYKNIVRTTTAGLFRCSPNHYGALNAKGRDFYDQNGYLFVRNHIPNKNVAKYMERFKKICMEKIRSEVLGVTTNPGFRYTRNGCDTLSAEERAFYEENGYFVVKNILSKEDIDKYTQRFKQICTKEITFPEMVVMRDITTVKQKNFFDETSVNKIQYFCDDPVLFSYCKHPKVLKYAEAIVGEDIMVVHTMLINKPPDTGTKTSRHPLHQDLHYFPFRPADLIVTSWTALEHVHRDNGCLVVVPGSHKGKLLKHAYPDWKGGVNWAYHGAKGYDENTPRTYLEMEPGDTVFFHPLLVHGSGRNKTTGFRKAISCHFASSHCHYIDVAGTTQQLMIDEYKNKFKRETGREAVDFDYRNLFLGKVRLVQGRKVNL